MATSPRGGNWKHTMPPASTGGASTPAAGKTSRRSWMPGGTAAGRPTDKQNSRRPRFLIAGLLTSLVVALIIMVIYFWSPQKTVELVLVAPDAPDSLALPENMAAVNGLNSVVEWTIKRGDSARLAAPLAETANDGWKTKLNRNAKSVILYFAAPGGADADGPFLWQIPADARGPADSHKLRVKEILDRLAGLPAGQPKWLIFDAAQPPPSWVHGNLHNDFARGLKTLDAAIEQVPALAVICSADENQRSWVSEEWRESVFNHFLVEAAKGAVGRPGDRVTGSQLLEYVNAEVNRWAIANRDEPQTLLVLPQATGRDRANKLEPSDVPPGGYVAAPAPDAPGSIPADLAQAWEAAEKLAGGKSVSAATPDTLDPVKWREYLDLLLKWERQFRLGQKGDVLSRRVAALAEELRSPPATDSLAIPVALPVGRALGLPRTEGNAESLRRLWSPPEGSNRGDEWAKLLGPDRNRETTLRLEVAAFVLAQVIRDGPTPDVLKRADDVLAVSDGSRVGAAETHFLRMLHRFLHPSLRPAPDLIREAIELRILAERAAWFGDASRTPSLEPASYPYAEQVYAWTRPTVEAADRERSLGQDQLFHTSPDAWQEATGHFDAARKLYEQAAHDAKSIASALRIRDRVFARLPYYARWLAGYRGKRSTADIEQLLVMAEQAARAAHDIDRSTREVPAKELLTQRLRDLTLLTSQADDKLASIVRAFDDDVATLSNTTHPSNWQALDVALNVPFLPARRRMELLGFVRSISHQLATKSEQQPGSAPAPATILARGRAQGRMALAMLNGGDSLTGVAALLIDPNPNTQWDALRDAGTRIGQRYRALSTEAAGEADKADATTPKDARPMLAQAAFLARINDPASRLRAGESPVAAEQRHRRHDLLLWQAQRTTVDGWADIVAGGTEQWYAFKAAQLFTRSAETLILNGATNLPPEESDRRLGDCRKQAANLPTQLELSAPSTRELADKPQWDFAISVAPSRPAPVGYPVMWLTLPGPPFTATPMPDGPRKILAELAKGAPAARDVTRFVAAKTAENPIGKLETNVLYRGNVYQKTTTIQLAGVPSLEYVYKPPPPTSPAAFAVIADEALVNGAVTLLIDLSFSMNDKLTGEQSKLQVLHEALEKVLDGLSKKSKKTMLTIAFFWGEGNVVRVEALPGVTKLDWRGDINQFRSVMKAVKAKAPIAGANTPLALAVRRLLSKEHEADFWPKASSGVRTLAVLTDGADNHSENEAGSVVRKALLDASEDTSLHLLFFALPGDEKATVAKQYAVLDDGDPFRQVNRTPPTMWKDDVSTADALANRLQQAMLPSVIFRKEETARGNKSTGLLRVTLPHEEQIQPSTALEPGVFNLYGLRANQKLQLDPGDRLLLRTRSRDDGFDLYTPTHAYDVAGKLGRPRATGQAGPKAGVYLSIPKLTFTDRTGWCDINMLATLEPGGQTEDAPPVVKAPRPLFAWFDVTHLEGKPAAGLTPRVRIENTPSLLAPAWTVDVKQWDRNAETARLPQITAAWVEGKPGGPAKFAISSLNDIDRDFEKLPKTATVAGLSIRLDDMAIDDIVGEGGLPDGKYLTVRVNYGKPGKPVFIRPGSLKGPRQQFLLSERHLYYDQTALYTARFGPLTPEDLAAGVELEMYSVADIMEAAAKTGRVATLRVPETPQNRKLDLPDRLRLTPAGK